MNGNAFLGMLYYSCDGLHPRLVEPVLSIYMTRRWRHPDARIAILIQFILHGV